MRVDPKLFFIKIVNDMTLNKNELICVILNILKVS